MLASAGADRLLAQVPMQPLPPAVTVSASSTATVQNDHLQAWLRAEAENANPAAAASQVNAVIAKALAEANRASFSITSRPNSGTLVEISFPSTRVLAE